MAGLAAVISGVMLVGTSGLIFVVGWALLGIGLAAVLAAIAPDRESGSGGVRVGYAARRPRAPSASRAQRA
jgi:hypothetical protein